MAVRFSASVGARCAAPWLARFLPYYPDLFAAGAIIAGLPYWSAFRRDEGHGFRAGAVFAGMGESGASGVARAKKWPKTSIWHGSHDEVVAPANAPALARQWIDIHQVDEAGATQDEVDVQTRMSWGDSPGAVVVEHYAIDGMAHGVPIDAKMLGSSGTLAPFMLDAGISSIFHSAKSWVLPRQTAAGTKTTLRSQWEVGSADHVLGSGLN